MVEKGYSPMLYWQQYRLMAGVLGADNTLMLKLSDLSFTKNVSIYTPIDGESVELCPSFVVLF